MKSAWNKKRVKSAIPLKLAEDIATAVTDVHCKMRTCASTRSRQERFTVEAMALMVRALQNQGPTQPLAQCYVDTVDMAAGGTRQILQEDSVSMVGIETFEANHSATHMTPQRRAHDAGNETRIKDMEVSPSEEGGGVQASKREWFPSWQYEHQLRHMDDAAEGAHLLRINLTQARDEAQKEEVRLGCTILCLHCKRKMRASKCRKKYCQAFL